MLVELMVENFAVADRLRLRFHAGLNLLTGETGSGKSILVDALGLLLGARASAEMVRSGADRARISGIFDVPRHPGILAVLQDAGLEWDDDELLLEREISANGKSRAFVCSRPVTVAVLRSIAPFLGDIHGQHDQQQLFEADAQLAMLDEYAGHDELREAVSSCWQHLRAVEAELEALDQQEREKLRLADLWKLQSGEIEGVNPQVGEDDDLEAERARLKNVTKLADLGNQAFSALYDSPEAANALLQQALRRIEDLARIDSSLRSAADTLAPALIAVEEVSLVLRDYIAELEANPQRLDTVETRLAAIDRLKLKYGATIPEILAFLDETRAKLDALEHTAEKREELQRDLDAARERYAKAATALSASRNSAAGKLARGVEEQLAALAMNRAVLVPELRRGADGPSGWDQMRFLVSANLGEEPKPLDKVASGGEISRIALALKTSMTVTTEQRTLGSTNGTFPRTLVFDEVDAGVSGRAAESVGKKLKELARSSQVLCVTHLPQIASFADHHFAVEKQEEQGRTVSRITYLDEEARRAEVARMLSGEQLTDEALQNAARLIAAGRGDS
jgi:DNA repair protein RecN (Recombination protein N)